MCFHQKINLILFLIFISHQFAFSQNINFEILNHNINEHYKNADFVFKLHINDLSPISAILEYKLSMNEQKLENLSLVFFTNKARKRFFKKDFKKMKLITSSHNLKLTDTLKKIFCKKETFDLCQKEEDVSFINSDGIYFILQIKRTEKGGLVKKCLITLNDDFLTKDKEFSKLIKKVLQESRFNRLEKEFKKNLPKGCYYNNGSHYWRKK